MAGYIMHVISHTHWDREWYLTFQQFRMRLVDLVDNLLDLLDRDADFKYFNFDGQTIVLEDYLAIKPQNEERLRKYIKSGRILIGPWYQLNDEFLVSGESTIRSLLIGHLIAEEFGAVTKIGYLPDEFGNISQMPQIFRGFGIDNCIFGRGLQLVDGRKTEFLWESPDGSQVLTILMAFWYNNTQRFPEDPQAALEMANMAKNQLVPHVTTPHLLFMNGESPAAQKTPGAQCLGTYTFQYAMYPHKGKWEDAEVWKTAHQHNVPVRIIQTGHHDGDLPGHLSFVRIEPANLVLSAIKKTARADSIIIRFYNTTDESVEGRVSFPKEVKEVNWVNLNEEFQRRLAASADTVKFAVGPKQIVTLEVKRKT